MSEFKLIFLFNQFYNLTAFDMLLNMLQYNKMFWNLSPHVKGSEF